MRGSIKWCVLSIKSKEELDSLKARWPDKEGPWPEEVTGLSYNHRAAILCSVSLQCWAVYFQFWATFHGRTDEGKLKCVDIHIYAYEFARTTHSTARLDSLLSASQAYQSVMGAGLIDGLKGKRQRERAGENPRSDTVTDLTGASRKKVPGGRNSAH